MAIQFQCSNPQCQKTLQCPDQSTDQPKICLTCGAEMQVLAPEQRENLAQGSQILGDYHLLRKLGQGGMGLVYEAKHLKLERRVALKILPQKFRHDRSFLERFQQEAKSAAALNHPNIVQLYDIYEEQQVHFFAMEFVDGESVQARLNRKGKLSLDSALRAVRDAAEALKYAHQRGIIHRDIKPDNLMLTKEGHVKLADLGLAKKIRTPAKGVTQTGTSMGTPYYMAPEQAEDAAHVDHRADIYALGITLLHLLTGKRPFAEGSALHIMMAHVQEPLPTGEDLGSPLPAAVESIIRKMAAKEPNERYQDYDSLLADLERALAGQPMIALTGSEAALQTLRQAPTVSAPFRKPRPWRRGKGLKSKAKQLFGVTAALFLSALLILFGQRRGRLAGESASPARGTSGIQPKGRVTLPSRNSEPLPPGPSSPEAPSAGPAKPAVHAADPVKSRKKPAETSGAQLAEVKRGEAGKTRFAIEVQKSPLPAIFKGFFEIPEQSKDKYGNPISREFDPETGLPLEIRHKKTGMHFVLIPAGKFLMGSPGDEPSRVTEREGIQHLVCLTKPFYLGKYEVTQPEWMGVMGNNPSRFHGDRNPVEVVHWLTCQLFLRKLNAEFDSLQKKKVSSAAADEAGERPFLRFGLPTEAQWEYACRAGTRTRFYFGDDLDNKVFREYAWFKVNSGMRSHPVGEKKPNALGLYDMHGNVWEWCQDAYGPYLGIRETDPSGPAISETRVYRGGSWAYDNRSGRSAARGHGPPDNGSGNLGFRAALHFSL